MAMESSPVKGELGTQEEREPRVEPITSRILGLRTSHFAWKVFLQYFPHLLSLKVVVTYYVVTYYVVTYVYLDMNQSDNPYKKELPR